MHRRNLTGSVMRALVVCVLAASVGGCAVLAEPRTITSAWPTATSERVVPKPTALVPKPRAIPTTSRITGDGDGILIASFLGDETRRFYGRGRIPSSLNLIWKSRIGTGKTSGGKEGAWSWSGTGWTGQPALVRDGGKNYLVVGGFDHGLRKIDAATGKSLWRYAFDDVIKGSVTIFRDPSAEETSYVAVVGSRRGYPLSFQSPDIAPLRAVSFANGTELWRLPVPSTRSYSRDADSSGFFLKDRYYAAVESGNFYALDPFETSSWKSFKRPKILAERLLLGGATASKHLGNLVLEASPALVGDTIYIASGSGTVYGMRTSDLKITFEYEIGTDLDGTAVPTKSGLLLVAVEKQYVSGKGGVLALDPTAPKGSRERWYFPTGNRAFGDWQGGVIGSVAVNDEYVPEGKRPRLAAVNAIDGKLYVISQDETESATVRDWNNKKSLPTPRLLFSDQIGGSISTPIFAEDGIVAAGYDGQVHLYSLDYEKTEDGDPKGLRAPDGTTWRVNIAEKDSFKAGSFESTPIIWDGRVYIGSRDGNLYCLGE